MSQQCVPTLERAFVAGACRLRQDTVANPCDGMTVRSEVNRCAACVSGNGGAGKARRQRWCTRLLLSDARWQLVPGSHMLLREMAGTALLQAADMVFVDGVRLAHFPLRSQQQYQQKILLGWLSTRLQNPTEMVAAESGQQMTAMFWHWRELFARLLTDPSLTPTCGTCASMPCACMLTACR